MSSVRFFSFVLAICLGTALAAATSTATAGPRPGAAGSAYAPARAVYSVPSAQIVSGGRYPAGRIQGGYRNPYAYPYYRYAPRRYPFGNGPYGPYGSNYGGYSGNAYDPGVYGPYVPIVPPTGPNLPDPDDAPKPVPAHPAPVPQAGPALPALSQPVPGTIPQSVPSPNRGYGDPAPYNGGQYFNPTYGRAQFFGTYPYGFTQNEMWYGHNGRVHGFGAYPALNYPYSYGPPSGYGFYSPQYVPQYDASVLRNFGPTYPTLGGFQPAAGFAPGW